MTVSLLDVNVLIALMWPAHEGHARVQHWFSGNARAGWATCPLTQAAFVRIVSNPAFSPDAVTPQEALNILSTSLTHPAHQFWPDDISFAQAVQPFGERFIGHQQASDAYLLGLAIHRKGQLATLDRSIVSLLPDKGAARNLLTLL